MKKEIKLSFILLLVFSAVCISWNTFANFFNGVGVSYVVMLIVVGTLAYLMITDKEVRARVRELFILSCVLCGLEFIVFVPFEYGTLTLKVARGFRVYQNVLSVIGLFFLAYVLFRFFTELSNVKFDFVETLLGHRHVVREKKPKKSKELEKGVLEDKPNQTINVADNVPVSHTSENEFNIKVREVGEDKAELIDGEIIATNTQNTVPNLPDSDENSEM